MELLVLFIIGLLIAIIVLPFVALGKANRAKRSVDDLVTRLSSLENDVRNLRSEVVPAPQPEVAVAAMETVPLAVPITTVAVIVPEKESVPPPIPERFIQEAVPQIATPPRPPINWEQFMGAKLFAWIGGLALFLGVAFFVKYSFEHNLISPELRVAIGFVVGASLVIGGLLLKRKENAVAAQTLCATGILVLYTVTFACRAYYHFAFFGLIPTFLLMTLITAIAFLLAVRLNAMVVAVLGIAGGFVTPVLLSTGEDYPLGLCIYIALLDIGLFAVAQRHRWNALAGLAAFILLAAWTNSYLSTAYLYTALTFYFIFALFHSATPLVLQRLRKIRVPWWSQAFPAASLLLMLMPIFQITELSIVVWPFVLIVDLLAFGLALATGRLVPSLAMLLLTLIAVGVWLLRIPSELTGLPTALCILGGFGIFFLVAASWTCRHLVKEETRAPKLFGNITDPGNLSVQLPALSAAMPFLLLTMVTLQLPLVNPSAVFGLALLLVILLLGMSEILMLYILPAIGLVCVLALEHAWHFQHVDPTRATLPLSWYLGFYALFTIFPFIFHWKFADKTAPWAAAALAGPLQFYLVYQVIRSAYPSHLPGLVPLAFALPSLLGLLVVLKRTSLTSPARSAQLALFGGAALFFITLIFPIQFDRQWITVGWALEGAALCWLFHRVPHPGLRLTGIVLLVVVFARLALNPAVLNYHRHGAFPILNWYLYTYGLATVCLFAAGRFLAPPRQVVLGSNVLPLLYTLGTVLAFLIVNIEIADYFSAPGAAALTFQFSGNFARDMSYSIAWALFALLMLIVGIRKQIAPVRYASLGLLGLTVVKLFFHDLSQLDQLYRISAFVVVAIIAMVASFLYQRFLGAAENANGTKATLTSAP